MLKSDREAAGCFPVNGQSRAQIPSNYLSSKTGFKPTFLQLLLNPIEGGMSNYAEPGLTQTIWSHESLEQCHSHLQIVQSIYRRYQTPYL
jgi:hypothetical protein